MKKLMMLLAVTTFFTANIFAQDSTKSQQFNRAKFERNQLSPQQKAVRATAKLDSLVSLSAEQKAKVQAINEKYDTQKQANEQEAKNLRQQQRTEIRKVLTPAQLDKLKAAREEFKKGHNFKDKGSERKQ